MNRSASATSTPAPPAAPAAAPSRRTLALGLLGSLLCYLAHPPAGIGWLAWIGPTPWLMLARAPQLPGRKPYLALWLAGFVFWLAAVQWIRLPYWANIFLLVPMAAYLGAYLPVFVGLARVGVHRFRLPVWIAGPIVWTGLEWLRARLLTGFLMASLAHTQVESPRIIQIADLAGEYGVTFLIVLVAGAIAAALPRGWVRNLPDDKLDSLDGRFAWSPLLGAAVAVIAAIAYGSWRLAAADADFRPGPRVAIIQSNMLADWKGTPERDAETMREQLDLSKRAATGSQPPVDLLVWPETMFRQPLFVRDPKNPPPAGVISESRFTAALVDLKAAAQSTGAALLVGIDRVLASKRIAPDGVLDADLLVYNAAVFVDREGELRGAYEKMHLLPFGEFIPFAAWLPMLADYAPITGNSLWGEKPAAFELDGVVYSPNICYESVLPQLIRRQVTTLAAAGQTPDVLVNLTNDAWFWGSSELDMHLASGVFRAVEMRTPLVIAANRGLSAYVDHAGRVVAVTERNRADALVVDVPLPRRTDKVPSPYARWGDVLALSCLGCCGALALAGAAGRAPLRRTSASRLTV
jgi:apolipoprotein N-acyltransferase